LKQRICIAGDPKLQEYSLQVPPTDVILLDPLPLNHGRGFGRHGRGANAKLSYGWPSVIVVGRLIVCRREACLPLSVALFVIKRMKLPSTYSQRVSLQDNSGVPFCSLSTWKV